MPTVGSAIISGVVRDGVIVPDESGLLIEGARVGIVLPARGIRAEVEAEFAAWDQVGADSWALTAAWERENVGRAWEGLDYGPAPGLPDS